MVYPALLPLLRTPRLPVVDWTDAPAYLNGLVRFAERRNLVSAHVPSHFNWPLPLCVVLFRFWTLSIVYCSTSHKRQSRQCMYDVTPRHLRTTVVAVEKQCVTYSECMSVALVIQHVKRMCRIISSPVAWPALQHFSTFSHKTARFSGREGGGVIEHKMRALILSTAFLWKIPRSTKNSAKYYNKRKLHQSSCKVSVHLVIFELTFRHRASSV